MPLQMGNITPIDRGRGGTTALTQIFSPRKRKGEGEGQSV